MPPFPGLNSNFGSHKLQSGSSFRAHYLAHALIQLPLVWNRCFSTVVRNSFLSQFLGLLLAMQCITLRSMHYHATNHPDHGIAPMVTNRCARALSALVPASGGVSPHACCSSCILPLTESSHATSHQDITPP